jgi:hypothetical protein
MRICKALIVAGTAIGFLPSVSTLAGAQSKDGLSIADNDAMYVDGRSFKIIAGHANGDASAMVRRSGARELGPAAIVFRKGDKLYLATVQPDRQSYTSDRRDYSSDRSADYGGSENRDYGGSENRDYGGSENRDYGGSENRDYGSDRDQRQASQRRSNNRRDYGGSENRDYGGSENRDYGGSENRDYGSSDRQARQRSTNNRQAVNDPDYAQYRLRKFFDENWTMSGSN